MEDQNFLVQQSQQTGLSNVQRKKTLQKISILQYLYFQGAKTNSELCEAFNISSPTSIRLLNQLIKEGWILKEGRGKSA
ncbi:MarR family transcriptional regulator [Antarcticibacterium sp. 1MA-6-2]|uniref:MarR family transcriptional regulator n=1 Tax=Antarcticibacterium sp. 1MA-6-2 TaxID=2908210 RepID=UPI001F2EC460|nr:MarR family transcriptional regulator [Antarcticibacterium sp. 1MA-6-2]UJH90143.1 MarR family transcriptional regulator [Antarcticibacterium sp. 1MA-6-2]